MSTLEADRLSNVWRDVREWPARERLALVAKIVQSLESETPADDRRQPSLSELIGAWRTDPVPTDEEIDRILEEERIGKHA